MASFDRTRELRMSLAAPQTIASGNVVVAKATEAVEQQEVSQAVVFVAPATTAHVVAPLPAMGTTAAVQELLEKQSLPGVGAGAAAAAPCGRAQQAAEHPRFSCTWCRW